MASESVVFESFFKVPLRNGLTRPKAVRGVGAKMVNMGEIFAHGRIGDIVMDRVRLDEREVQSFLLEPGDLLFARQSLVLEGAGKCSIFLGSAEDVTFESHIIRARIDRDRGNPNFFYYFFQSPSGRNAIRSIVEQVAAAGIRGSDLAKLQVPNIPLSIQDAIASILSTLDNKISLNRGMQETLEGMAHALFKSWFVDFDPVHAKAGRRDSYLPKPLADLFPHSFEDSESGQIPKGWTVLGLDEIADFLNGLALQKFPPKDDRFLPVIKIAQLRSEDTSGADKASAELAPEYVINDGDVLFSWSGSLECVLWAGGRGALNQHLFKVTSASYPKWFYLSWIHHHLDDFRRIFAAIGELGDARYAPALVLFNAARDACDARPRRDRDACANIFDAMESASRVKYNRPADTFGQIKNHLERNNLFRPEIIVIFTALNQLRNQFFGHGAPFPLSGPEVDFIYLTCVGAILLFTRTP